MVRHLLNAQRNLTSSFKNELLKIEPIFSLKMRALNIRSEIH